jgi:HEAT repeat protein
VLNAAIAGEPEVVLNASVAELLAEPLPVGDVISAALDRAGPGLTGHWRVVEVFRRSGLSDELFNSLTSPNPLVRAAAARLCGAMRLPEAALWIADLVRDSNPRVGHWASWAGDGR